MQSLPIEVPAVVFVELSHEELLERAEELSVVLQEISTLEVEASEAKEKLKFQLEPMKARRRALERCIRLRQEERPAQQPLFVDPEHDVPPRMRTKRRKGGGR